MANGTTRRSLAGGSLLAILGTAAIVRGAPSSPRANPDAAVIALCCEYVGLSERHDDLCAKQAALPTPGSGADHAEWCRLDDIVVSISERLGALEDEIPELPAVTPAGRRAKAEALLWAVRHISPLHGGPFSRSLARDLLRRA